MRKIISMVITLMLGFLVGCGVNSEVQAEDRNAKVKYLGESNGIYTYRDRETGVHYLVYRSNNGAGITPRYTNSGEIYVD